MGRYVDLTGQKFGRLTVVEYMGKTDSGTVLWKCRCDCGNEVIVRRNNLTSGNTNSCGCYKFDRIRESVFEDVTGQRFGALTCLKFVGRSIDGAVKWLCHCDCGKDGVYFLNNLKRGHTVSCGCFRQEISVERGRALGLKAKGHKYSIRHGHSRTSEGKNSPTYLSWKGMISRTTNPNVHNFNNYGGRGISVCDRWRNSFENFLEDMGERPPGHTLDRVNNNGNYEPGNCRWATWKEQAINRRSKRKVEPKCAS